jgi:hypothetical protein
VIEGEFPHFRIFPIEVRVDFANELVLVNKRKVRKLHPEAVAALVERELDRLHGERFNPSQFMKALVRAFDVLVAEAYVNGTPTQAVPLRQVYELLTVRAGSSAYTLNQFRFAISRLRREGNLILEGRRIVFGSARNRSQGLVIPEPGGHTEVFGSLEVAPIKTGEEDA